MLIHTLYAGCLSFCSILVLGASGHYIDTTLHGTLFIDGLQAWPQASPDGFSVLDLAAAILTLAVIKPMYVTLSSGGANLANILKGF